MTRAYRPPRRSMFLGLVAAAMGLVSCGGDGSPAGPSGAPTPTPAPPPAPTARYEVTFGATWSAATHPDRFPADAHFSPLIGGTHNSSVSFWSPGLPATEGIRRMAEQGRVSPLDNEVMAAISARTAEGLIRGDGLPSSPGSTSLVFEISPSYPLVTLVTMVAPSPDWFVGMSGLSLLEGGGWVAERQVVLYAYDAGTDDGEIYDAPDRPASPRRPVARLQTAPFLVAGQVPPLGTFTFRRLDP
jgi:Spondin_N